MLVTAGLHALCTLTTALPGVLAPVAARDFGLPASQVGVMIALHYLITVPSGLASAALMSRYGAIRVLQMAAVGTGLAALSCAVAGFVAAGTALPESAGWLFVAWLLLTGMVYGTGYGLINPVSANVLFFATPLSLRALAFSLKQTAVPIGFGLAGLVIPALLILMRWQWVAVVLGLMMMTVVLLLAAAPLRMPAPARSSGRLLRFADFVDPVTEILRDRGLRRRALMALAYSSTQTVTVAYLVTFLSLEIKLSLVAAGSILAISQVGGVIGRVLFGVAADLWLKPGLQLGLSGIATGLACLAMVTITPQWPYVAISALCLVFGMVSFAWNGVFHAEIASIAPPQQIGRLTGAMQVFISGGAMGGPAAFSLILAVSGSFSLAFLLLALPTLLVGSISVLAIRPRRAPAAARGLH